MRNTPFIHTAILIVFLVNLFGPMPLAQAHDFRLPTPGVMVNLSPSFDPPILKGIKVHPDNPFRFEFILDKGDSNPDIPAKAGRIDRHSQELGIQNQEQLKVEATKLIKYFLASLTIPEKDLWVNLSPYEKDRIIPNSFGLTVMGRDLLAEDYMLKQITASLIYPEGEIGKKFWKRIYEEAYKKFGTTNIPVNTFNKVWIIPDKAVVYENAKAGTAYVVESRLKVMLEQDYLSLQKHQGQHDNMFPTTSDLGSQVVREIVIPELTREVNDNQNFAQLRQVYNSLILATWYKKKIKDSILEQVYADKKKVAGVNIDDPNEKERIYQQYLKAFKKGVFNYIKEETDVLSQETIPRKYFSGGFSLLTLSGIQSYEDTTKSDTDASIDANKTDSLFEVSANILSAGYARIKRAILKHVSSIRQAIHGPDLAMNVTGDQAMRGATRESPIKEFDLNRDFQKVDSLGSGQPVTLVVKEINTPASLALRTSKWDPKSNKLAAPLRDVDRNAFVMVLQLGHNMSREKSTWQIGGAEPKAVAMRDDITLVAFADEIVVLDTFTGKPIGNPIRDPRFRGLHTIEFHPFIKNRVLVSSGGIDRFFELEIDFKHSTHRIIYEWSAWKQGFNTNEHVSVYEQGQVLPRSKGEILTYEQAVQRAQQGAHATSKSIVVINPDQVEHPLGIGQAFRILDPNGVFYGKTADKFIATLFHVGKLVEIDRLTGKMRTIDSNLDKPHGFIAYGNGYLLSNSRSGKLLEYDHNYKPIASYDFSTLPVNPEMERHYHSDWIQYSYPLGDGLIAAVDSRRSTIIVLDPSRKIYSSYPYNSQWVLQSVSPVLSEGLSSQVGSENIVKEETTKSDEAMDVVLDQSRTTLPMIVSQVSTAKKNRERIIRLENERKRILRANKISRGALLNGPNPEMLIEFKAMAPFLSFLDGTVGKRTFSIVAPDRVVTKEELSNTILLDREQVDRIWEELTDAENALVAPNGKIEDKFNRMSKREFIDFLDNKWTVAQKKYFYYILRNTPKDGKRALQKLMDSKTGVLEEVPGSATLVRLKQNQGDIARPVEILDTKFNKIWNKLQPTGKVLLAMLQKFVTETYDREVKPVTDDEQAQLRKRKVIGDIMRDFDRLFGGEYSLVFHPPVPTPPMPVVPEVQMPPEQLKLFVLDGDTTNSTVRPSLTQFIASIINSVFHGDENLNLDRQRLFDIKYGVGIKSAIAVENIPRVQQALKKAIYYAREQHVGRGSNDKIKIQISSIEENRLKIDITWGLGEKEFVNPMDGSDTAWDNARQEMHHMGGDINFTSNQSNGDKHVTVSLTGIPADVAMDASSAINPLTRFRSNVGTASQNGTGGINFTSANMNLQTQNAGEAIKFHLDAAQLAQLQNAPGFVPVIINI